MSGFQGGQGWRQRRSSRESSQQRSCPVSHLRWWRQPAFLQGASAIKHAYTQMKALFSRWDPLARSLSPSHAGNDFPLRAPCSPAQLPLCSCAAPCTVPSPLNLKSGPSPSPHYLLLGAAAEEGGRASLNAALVFLGESFGPRPKGREPTDKTRWNQYRPGAGEASRGLSP